MGRLISGDQRIEQGDQQENHEIGDLEMVKRFCRKREGGEEVCELASGHREANFTRIRNL